MEIKEALAFDDVLLTPKYSDIESRSEVDLSSKLGNDTFQLPIISAPMDTVTEYQLANALAAGGGLGIIHRYNSIQEQINQLVLTSFKAGCAIPTDISDNMERANALVRAGCRLLCVDVAHGHHVAVLATVRRLKETFPGIHIMAGNVATWLAARDLASFGADSIKIGIGGGSICSTRTMTGHGVPTFQAILNCFEIKKDYPNVKLIADGGIKTPGDIVKSLAAGADFVMLGSMFAGTFESPGEVIEEVPGYAISSNHVSKKYKIYRGMASKDAQMDWRGKVGSMEGISTRIPLKGTVKEILANIRTNVASGLSYSGARNLRELRERATFIKQTYAGCVESSTHILNVGGTIV